MKVLFNKIDTPSIVPDVSFDLSLARGLDYYTGLIFEATLLDLPGVGSVAAGGRYDELVGKFSEEGVQIPCVGFSIGFDRIFSIMEARAKNSSSKIRTVETEVFVISGPEELCTEQISLCTELWDAQIKADMYHTTNVQPLTEFQQCEKDGIPFQVIIGEEEKKSGSVKIRDTFSKKELTVKREEVGRHLLAKLPARK
jgi:histidyl-tRNA synthetase